MDRAAAVGVAAAVTVADDMAAARWVVQAASWDDRVFAAVALHPTRTATMTTADRAELERLAAMPRVVAVGETGLLQTSDYARAIIGGEALPAGEVEARVLVRMGRRDVIMRSNPVRLTAFLGEAALHEMIGGPRVMADQLRHLTRVAESDTITIQVVRSSQGWHPGLGGQFVLYDFDGAPSIVLLAHHRTGAFVIEPDDVAVYKTAVDEIHRLAMSPADSLTLITQTAHESEAAP